MAYTVDTVWRNRSTFVTGRDEVAKFLTGKWERELDYRLIKEIWAHSGNRIAVRFCYEYHNEQGEWFRAYGTLILGLRLRLLLRRTHLAAALFSYMKVMRIGSLMRRVT